MMSVLEVSHLFTTKISWYYGSVCHRMSWHTWLENALWPTCCCGNLSRSADIPLQRQVFNKNSDNELARSLRAKPLTVLESTLFNILWYFKRIPNFCMHGRAEHSEVVESPCLHQNVLIMPNCMTNGKSNWS